MIRRVSALNYKSKAQFRHIGWNCALLFFHYAIDSTLPVRTLWIKSMIVENSI